MPAGTPKSFSIRHGLDVANTIVLDSNRNISNVNNVFANTINATTYYTSAGHNLDAEIHAAYSQANLAYSRANTPLTVREIYTSNSTVVNSFANINTIQFDTESGLAVVDESNSTVTIQLNNWS
jgi:hypothetical protein